MDAEKARAVFIGGSQQRLAVNVQRVEHEWRQGDGFPHGCNVFNPSKPAHRDLKGFRPAVWPQGDRFTVQDRLPHGEAPRPLDKLRQPSRNILELSREEPHVVAALVDLDAGPVQLVLESRRVETLQRGVNVLGARGQHRCHGNKQAQRVACETRGSLREGCQRQIPKMGGEHKGLSDIGRRQSGGCSNRVEEDAFERSLSEFPNEQL